MQRWTKRPNMANPRDVACSSKTDRASPCPSAVPEKKRKFIIYKRNIIEAKQDWLYGLWLCCIHTSDLGVMDGEHVDGDDLQHTCAAERGGAMLEKGPKLLQHSTGYSRKTLHPEDPNRTHCVNQMLFTGHVMD